MPAPTPASASRTAPATRKRFPRKIALLLGIAAVGAIAALALPRVMAGGADEPVTMPGAPLSSKAKPKQAAVKDVPDDEADKKPVPAVKVEVAPDGDLAIELEIRWCEVPTGATIPAEVKFANHGPKPVHVPAPGEPHPTLALVIIDEEGREVRRVVESSADPLPRRTQLVPSGGVVARSEQLVSATDDPLPPGKYKVHAEFRPDPLWRRLGLPMWTAPNGALRSEIVSLTVLPR